MKVETKFFPLFRNHIVVKSAILAAISLLVGVLSKLWGFNSHQTMAMTIFLVLIIGSILFWDLRLSFCFLGTSLLLITKTLDFENFLKFASFEIMLFLIGMMILMGYLKDVGFFSWILTLILRIKAFTATKFLILISIVSAFFSCAVDEVTSIIIMVAAILEICDFFDVNPIPFIICSVLTTNIGSIGTVLGNPVGILIAAKSGLTFEDFLLKSFPFMLIVLGAVIMLLVVWFRKVLKDMDEKIKEQGINEMFIKLISIPPEMRVKKGLWFFMLTLFIIGLHHRLEILFNLPANTLLFITPLMASAVMMLFRFDKVKRYVQHDIEWMTLLFFIFLFAQAGTLKHTGVTDVFAVKLAKAVGNNPGILVFCLLWISSIASSILDNVVVVASFIPMVQSFYTFGFAIEKLWWALLFGGCFGGNITIIGSTANIIALGVLEKEKNIKIKFFEWFWVGLSVGILSTFIAWIYLLI